MPIMTGFAACAVTTRRIKRIRRIKSFSVPLISSFSFISSPSGAPPDVLERLRRHRGVADRILDLGGTRLGNFPPSPRHNIHANRGPTSCSELGRRGLGVDLMFISPSDVSPPATRSARLKTARPRGSRHRYKPPGDCTNSHRAVRLEFHGKKAPAAGHANHRFTNSPP